MYISILSDYPCLEVERVCVVRRPTTTCTRVLSVLSTGLLRYARVLASCTVESGVCGSSYVLCVGWWREVYERGESGWTCLVRFFYKSKLRLNVGNRGLAVAESNISIRVLKFGSSRSVDRQSPKIHSKCSKSTKSRKITRTPKNDRHHPKSPPCAKQSQTPTRAPKFHRPTKIHQHPN